MNPSGLVPTTLRTRLRAIILATSTVALVLASGAYLLYDYFALRHSAERRLQVLTDLVAPRATPAAAKLDRRAASEAIATLTTAPGIVSAAIFAQDGSLLARYLRPDAADETVPVAPGPDAVQTVQGDFILFRPLSVEGRRVGTIYLRSDLDDHSERLRLNIVVVGVMVLGLLVVSYALSARMVGAITAPLSDLSQVVQAVTSRRDYTLRAKSRGPQELAFLIDGINDMLSQIQVRDGALTLARNELENRVTERTSELTFVNQELSTEISERKRMEASLRESEERYRQLVEFSPDAILILDGARILFVNGAALRMFGARSQDELIGTMFLDRVSPEFSETVLNRVRQVIQQHQSTLPLEEGLLKMDGTPLDGEVQETPFIYQGQPAVQVVIRDISKRKEIERMKDEFVSTVSHELRTPLTSIQGSLGLVANGVTGAIPPSAKPLVDIAYKNCGRLILLINDILDSEKIAAGKMKFALKDQELQPLVEQAIEANRAYGAQFAVRFETGETVPGARVALDADRFMQVMANLLSNAAKFSPKGDVVTVSVHRVSGRIRVAVSDRGDGIPPEFRDRLFQKFSQADSSDRRAKGGTGLGLSISKAIVERHGGSISFTSDMGKGTTFVVELPEKNPTPAAAEISRGPRALVCDDEPAVADILRTVLDREKFRTVVVHSLREAREALEKGPVDLITLDFMLPDGNGLEFIRELRKSEALKDVPVLFVSPLAGSAQELGGGSLGRVEFFEKPIDLARLAAAARAAVAPSPGKLEGAPT